MTYGATPTEWAAWQSLGLESDLLPVVSDPTAKISPKSNMKDLGKTPSRFNQQGEAVGIPKWPLHVTTEGDVARWARDNRLGICLQTRNVKAIDIDIADPVQAARVREFIAMGLGDTPLRRRSNSGKCLIAVRLDAEFSKRIIKTAHGNIELLSNGQQFIAGGTHPSGVPYEWVSPDGVIGVPDELPSVSLAELDGIWHALADAFALPDGVSEVRNGMVPTRPRVASDMQDPVVQWLDENGWVTEFDRDGKVHVRCPWEDEHTSDSGPTATSWFPAGVGGFAQGHFKCMHAHCSTRTDGDFFEAIGYGSADFDVVETVANAKGVTVEPLPAFTRARNGQIEATLNNVLMALRRPDVCGVQLGFDTFKDALMFGEGGGWKAFRGNIYTNLRSRLETGNNGFKPIGRELMRDAVHAIAYEQRFDSAIQWAESLQWDGAPRVENFWATHFGVEDTAYSRAVGLYTWSSFAGRCLTPGEKCDMVPVLIGLQGAGKTSMIEALAPTLDAFTGINLEKKDEDIARGIRGKLVCELAELRGLASRDAEGIKDWTSRRFEEWVPKYEEFSTRYGRRFLGIGTGNREGFLDDETGERRWLPMIVGNVDVDRIKRDRDQLWAEGIVLYRRVGIAWQEAVRLARGEHHKFKVGDTWCEHIEEWLGRSDMDGPRDRRAIRLRDVLVSAIGIPIARISRREELRAGKALSLLGFKKGFKRVDGIVTKVWMRDAEPLQDFGDLA